MENRHKNREESHLREQQEHHPAQNSPPADQGHYQGGEQGTSRTGSPYRGRPAQQGSRRPSPREQRDML